MRQRISMNTVGTGNLYGAKPAVPSNTSE
jgi:hypothetical protein